MGSLGLCLLNSRGDREAQIGTMQPRDETLGLASWLIPRLASLTGQPAHISPNPAHIPPMPLPELPSPDHSLPHPNMEPHLCRLALANAREAQHRCNGTGAACFNADTAVLFGAPT